MTGKIRLCPHCNSVLKRRYGKRGMHGQVPRRYWYCKPCKRRIRLPILPHWKRGVA